MTIKYIKIGLIFTLFSFVLTSCEKDLDEFYSSDKSSAVIYADFNNYNHTLAKCYAGLALGGQEGGDGMADIGGIDGGMSNYLRQYFQLQELPTDEAVIGWGDTGLPDLHNMNWSSDNQFTTAMYYRIFYQISLANEFIRETSDAKLSSRGITGDNAKKAKEFRAEARFLRALSYYHALDFFGNVPFVDENFTVGVKPPQRITREKLFDYIESELLAISKELKEPRTNAYGRADKAAAWMLLAKLYLNAEVYTNKNKNNEVVKYTEKVINAGYSLMPKYEELFLANNDVNNNEVIFPINFNGIHSQTWGGTTYIIHAAVGGSMNAANFGINGGWFGLRVTPSFVEKFPSANSKDSRGRFYTQGQSLEINNIGDFSNGYAFIKFKNITSKGEKGSDNTGNFVDTDFPLFRLADAYLMYAEAVLRGGGGDKTQALTYVNKLRERAYGNNSGNISLGELTLDFILNERSRELSWEATRRTDLIRYGKFVTSDYLWAWKGSVKNGKAVEQYRKLYPIPSKDLIANPNLKQNPGY